MMRRLFFEFQYRFSKPPWDSGTTPPEVVAQVASGEAKGRALDLGCGTGTNAIYLAQHGLTVTAVDFSAKAIAIAKTKAKRANVAIDFHVADVTRLDYINPPFDFILDIGCLHAIDGAGCTQYAETIARLTRPGSLFMLYAFSPRPNNEQGHVISCRNAGITPDDVRQLFAESFALEHVEHGTDRERASAWYWFRRQ